MNKILDEAEHRNPRLREILLLYMLQIYDLNKVEHKLSGYEDLLQIFKEHEKSLVEMHYKSDANSPFYKVYHLYIVRRDYNKNRNIFKSKFGLETKSK